SASSAIDTDARMLRSSSTRAIVFGTLSPKILLSGRMTGEPFAVSVKYDRIRQRQTHSPYFRQQTGTLSLRYSPVRAFVYLLIASRRTPFAARRGLTQPRRRGSVAGCMKQSRPAILREPA